jgi:hypothetical protein
MDFATKACPNCGLYEGHTHWCKENATVSTANDRQVAGDHYKSKAIQPWDYIAGNNIGYLEGNVIKYVSRWRDKGGVADLEKARHYLDKLIELQRK